MALASLIMTQLDGVCSVLRNRLHRSHNSMFILCLLTAFIWGITNWFLKEGSGGLREIKYDNRIKQFGAEIWYFFTNARVRQRVFRIEILHI
jgi:hypothetical protein